MTPRTRRPQIFAVAIATVISLVAVGCTKNPESAETAQLINNERRARGIPELTLNPTLIDKAQDWAEHMARQGRISHSDLRQGTGTGWRALGENVGWARSVDEAHTLFMRSSSHRTTLLDRRYSSFGVGVAVVNGRYYVVHVFGG